MDSRVSNCGTNSIRNRAHVTHSPSNVSRDDQWQLLWQAVVLFAFAFTTSNNPFPGQCPASFSNTIGPAFGLCGQGCVQDPYSKITPRSAKALARCEGSAARLQRIRSPGKPSAVVIRRLLLPLPPATISGWALVIGRGHRSIHRP